MHWVAYISISVLVLLALIHLISNRKTEKHKEKAWIALALLTALALLPVFSHYAMTISRNTTNPFMFGIKFIAALSAVFGWVLSIAALIAAIVGDARPGTQEQGGPSLPAFWRRYCGH